MSPACESPANILQEYSLTYLLPYMIGCLSPVQGWLPRMWTSL
jgi:hypothetical protein